MSVSADEISKLRRMTGEATGGDYNDDELSAIIEDYPLTTGYDLNAAAAEVWSYKAALYASEPESFSADGKSFNFGELMRKAQKMQAHYASLASETYSPYGFVMQTRGDLSDDALLVDPFA